MAIGADVLNNTPFMNTRLIVLLLAISTIADPAFAEFKAAIAVRVVTPEPMLPVSGGIGPSKPATKKEGDLTVRALVLADEGTQVAIVSAD